MSQFNLVDALITGIILLSVITGLMRGFVKELIAICVWIMAIWLGYTYCQDVGVYLKSYIHNDSARIVCGFIVVLLASIIVGSILNALLSFILKSTGLTGTDRLLGMGFGFVRGVFIVSLIILAIQMTSLFTKNEQINKSSLYGKFMPIVNWMYGFSPSFIKKVKSLESNTEFHVIEP